jgi:hypothetical protein
MTALQLAILFTVAAIAVCAVPACGFVAEWWRERRDARRAVRAFRKRARRKGWPTR